MRIIKKGAHIDAATIMPIECEIGYNSVILSGESNPDITQIGENSLIGSNCTINKGVKVGARSVVKPGSVVTSSIPPMAIVEGNPAVIKGYVETTTTNLISDSLQSSYKPRTVRSKVDGVLVTYLPYVPDMRGSLSAGEFPNQVPFLCQRYFLVYDVPSAEARGEHAHKECHQFLIAVKGSVHVVVDDGATREEYLLDRPTIGLYLPPLTWGIQYNYSHDAVLLVFASDHYDPQDYIRNYDDFVAIKRSTSKL